MTIESILGIRKRCHNSSIASLSIDLFPEFGWTIGNNERAFGPGTSFQGHVVVKCKEFSARATSLRLVFQGVEAMLAYEMGPGVLRSHTSQLFTSRLVLWKKSETQDALIPMRTYKFLFTIQMPMIQFPPTMNHDYYRCTFKLSAYLDPSLGFGEVPVMTQIDIKYIPLIETRLLKDPIYLHDLKKKKSSSSSVLASVKLYSIEYVAGSTIQATVCISKGTHGVSFASPFPIIEDLTITLYLYQVSKFNLDAEPILTQLVATQTHIIRNNAANSIKNFEREYQVSMKINESLPPSFEYSSIMSLTYKLKVKIYLKKAKITNTNSSTSSNDLMLATPAKAMNCNESINAPNSNTNINLADNSTTTTTVITTDHVNEVGGKKSKSAFKKFLGKQFSGVISVFETPIIIGTMGSGIRTGDELKDYSCFDKNSVDAMPRPRFIKSLEYEDALPKYEAFKLPSYGDPYSQSVRSVRSNRSSYSSATNAIIMATATPSITSMHNII